VKEMMKHT